MNDKIVAERDEVIIENQPYGFVKFKDAKLYSYEYEGRTYHYAEGVVVESRWHGALMGGVPVTAAKEKYPVGSTQKEYYIAPEKFATGHVVKIAM